MKIRVIIIVLVVLLCSCTSKTPQTLDYKTRDNVYLQNQKIGGVSKTQVVQRIKHQAAILDKAPNDALINDRWEVTKEEPGIKVDADKTLQKIFAAKDGENISLVTKSVSPKVTRQELKGKIVDIGSLSTPILDDSQSRNKNLELAIKSVNYHIIYPGNEFSFNRIVGNTTSEKGYELATIYINDGDETKNAKGIGGGISQLSTTLYNAALIAGLNITERHPHTKAVTYVKRGMDAAVVYNSKDFRFKNNKRNPIMIKADRLNGKLYVNIIERKS